MADTPALKRLAAMACDYSHVKVKLVGYSGHAFAIMGVVRRALRKAGASKDEVQAYVDEAMSGDYNHLLQTTMDWVTVT